MTSLRDAIVAGDVVGIAAALEKEECAMWAFSDVFSTDILKEFTTNHVLALRFLLALVMLFAK